MITAVPKHSSEWGGKRLVVSCEDPHDHYSIFKISLSPRFADKEAAKSIALMCSSEKFVCNLRYDGLKPSKDDKKIIPDYAIVTTLNGVIVEVQKFDASQSKENDISLSKEKKNNSNSSNKKRSQSHVTFSGDALKRRLSEKSPEKSSDDDNEDS